MTGRLFAALAAAVMLSGCWSGPPLFDSRDAVAALPDGIYYVREPASDGASERVQQPGEDSLIVRRQPDNSLHVTVEGDTEGQVDYRILAVPIAGMGEGRFALQVQRRRDIAPDDVGYMLLDTRPSPDRLTILPCSSAVRAVVEASGGSVSRDPNSGAQCLFRNRATLLRELRRVVASEEPSPGSEMELVEVAPRR